jgi:hypothetical protein
MDMPYTYSGILNDLRDKLANAGRGNYAEVLIQELAMLRLQVRNLTNIVSALSIYQDVENLLPEKIANGEIVRTLPVSVNIDASEHLTLLDGFQGLEYSSTGRAFRWTGPSRTFRFNVLIDKSKPVDIRLYCMSHGNDDNREGMRLHVDGELVKLGWDPVKRCFWADGVDLKAIRRKLRPDAADADALTVIEFEIASHLTNKNPEDKRDLGVPFYTLSMEATASRPKVETRPS